MQASLVKERQLSLMGERNRIYDLINDKSMMLYEAKIAHNNRENAKISAVKADLTKQREVA